MIYILKSAIILALLFSCYNVFLSHDTFHRFKRFILQPIMQLNGETFTKDNVPYLLADDLKEMKTTRVSDSEFIVNLITK